ncbi:MAG TPA: heavy metal translocating P-type ATPase [Thermomicrobiales bacterium]|nr:cadmium-translocating P-type ATPase [Chloroflexota bacterium]HQX63324.1 heavy metal translocating P-type ATPase [Thermomicrobiales bacterium]HQZ90438.1 heavy metal translocating P-type ATPase [Thermomicrobiales bacterium]HRA31006.1 heavy metal translocating P-type ATPase [Thermomicrobiales bacterium]
MAIDTDTPVIASIEEHDLRPHQHKVEEERPSLLDRYGLAVATVTTLIALLLGWGLGRAGVIGHSGQVAFYVVAYIAGGTFATRTALTSLWNRNIDVDLLMIVAAIGAAIIDHWVEGAILLFLFSLGNTLEHYAMGRTYSAIRALMDLRPDEARVLRDGTESIVPVEELRLDDVVIIKNGERIATDGQVVRGESAVDQSAITGESMPVVRRAGDGVFAGTINGHGVLHVQVTRLASESTLAKIIQIVETAQAEKSATQRFTDRFEGLYAGGVILAAALYAIIPALATDRTLNETFYQAMILLVVASPCALVISTPASTLSALANAARQGILFKGAAHLEDIGVARVVAFDKTGTLTVGRPRMTDLRPASGVAPEELLRLTAAVERLSEHPLGAAVVEAALERRLPVPEAHDGTSIIGRGIEAVVDGDMVLAGNDALFVDRGFAIPAALIDEANELRDNGKSTMFVGIQHADGVRFLGVIGVADTVRPVAREVIEQLKALGVEKTIILTGDNERAARAIARQTGVDEFHSQLMPQEKLDIIEELKRQYGTVIMVGDGVNDAPALATASIGIAMGAAGTDVALETADVVLMADDLTRLPYAVELSRRTRRIIRQNLTFALGVIVVLVTGTLLGITTLPLGVIGHEGSTIIVVSNGLRLLGGSAPKRRVEPVGALQPAGD